MEALEEPVSSVVEAVHSVLERTPPELAADISERGIVMTGEAALFMAWTSSLSIRQE